MMKPESTMSLIRCSRFMKSEVHVKLSFLFGYHVCHLEPVVYASLTIYKNPGRKHLMT